MSTPKISIIIPVYNAEPFLISIIRQLRNQTNQNYELLFINDGSTDNSGHILELLTKDDEHIRVFHHVRNRCQGAARNTGLDHANAEYIVYIDADDTISNNYLESLLHSIEKYNADIAICNSIWVYPHHEESRNMFLKKPDQQEVVLTGKEALERYFNIFMNDIRIPVEPWGRIIRRSMLEKYHIRNPETLYEDIVMTFSELLFAEKVVLIHDYLYQYNRKNAAAATFERRKQYILDFPLAFVGIRNVLLDNGLYEQYKNWLTRFYFRYLAGVYEFHAKGGSFPLEMHQAILTYRTLLPDPVIQGSEEYISMQLFSFELEMERNAMPEIFSLFIAVHPDIHSLIQRNIFSFLMRYLNRWMQNKSIRNIYKKMKRMYQ